MFVKGAWIENKNDEVNNDRIIIDQVIDEDMVNAGYFKKGAWVSNMLEAYDHGTIEKFKGSFDSKVWDRHTQPICIDKAIGDDNSIWKFNEEPLKLPIHKRFLNWIFDKLLYKF
jgi:hypothetical protein